MALRTEAEFAVGMTANDTASPTIKKAGVTADEAAAKIEHLSIVMTGLNQASELIHKAFEFVKESLHESVGSFLEAEHALHDLEVAMKLTGTFSEEAVEDFKKFNDVMKSTTLINGAQLVSFERQATVLGKSREQTKELIETATDLAAALHEDVGEAFTQVLGASNGFVRGLGRMFPQLKTLVVDGHDGAAAVTYLHDRLKGFGEAAANTAHGQMEQLHKAVFGLNMAFGELAVTLVRGGDAHVGPDSPIAQVTALVKAAKDEIKSFVPVMQKLHDDVVANLAGIKGAFTETLANVNLDELGDAIAFVTATLITGGAAWLAYGASAGAAGAVTTGILGTMGALAATILQMTRYLALMSAQFLVVGVEAAVAAAGIATIAVGIDLVVHNVTHLGDLFKVFFNAVYIGFETVAGKISKLLGDDSGFKKTEANAEAAFVRMNAAANNLDYGYSGKALNQLQTFVGSMQTGFAAGEKAARDAAHATHEVGDEAGKGALKLAEFTDELKKQYEEVIKKSKEALDQARKAGLDEIDQAKLKRDDGLKEIADIRRKIEATGQLTKAMRVALDLAQQQRKIAGDLEISAALKKQADELEKSSKEALKAANQIGLSEVQLANERLKDQLEAITAVRDRAVAEGHLTKELEAQLALDEKRAQQAHDISVDKARLKAFREQADAAASAAAELAKMGLEGQDLLDEELRQSLIEIDATETKLRNEGLLTEALEKQLDLRRQLAQDSHDKKTSIANDKELVATRDAILEGMATGAVAAAAILEGGIVTGIADGLQTLADLPMKIGDALANIDRLVTQLISSFPAAITVVLNKLPLIFQKFIDAIPQIASAIAAAAPVFAREMADAAPGFVKAIMAELPKLVDAFADALIAFADALPAVFTRFLEGLPRVIEAVLQGLDRVAVALIRAIPEVAIAFAENAAPIALALVQGLIDGAADIVGAFVEMLVKHGPQIGLAIAKSMAITLPIAIAQGVARALADVFKKLGGNFKIQVPKDVAAIGGQIADGFKKALNFAGDKSKLFNVSDLTDAAKALDPMKKAQDAAMFVDAAIGRLGNFWKDIWDRYLKPFVDAIVEAWRTVWNMFLRPLVEGIKAAWAGILELLRQAWSGLRAVWDAVLPVFQAIVVVLRGVWDVAMAAFNLGVGVLKSVWDFAIGGLNALWVALKAIWKDVGDILTGKIGALDGVRKLLGDVFDAFIKPFTKLVADLGGNFTTFTDAIKDAGSKIWQGIVDAATKGLTVLTGWGGKIWDGLKDATVKGFQAYLDLGQKIADGLRDGIKGLYTVFSGIGATIYDGLKTALSGLGTYVLQILNDINPANLARKMFAVDFGGRGKVEQALGIDIPFMSFATGGIVPGNARTGGDSLMNDRILAMLSPDEAIIPRSKMQDPFIKQIVAAILAGTLSVPAYAKGGYIGKAAHDISHVGDGGGGGAIDQLKGQLGDLANAGKAGFEGLGDLGADGLSAVQGFLGDLGPEHLWDLVFDKVKESIMTMFQHNAMAAGGPVMGAGDGDKQMKFLEAGEFVVNRRAAARNSAALSAMNLGAPGAGGPASVVIQKIEINAKTNLDAEAIRREVIPAIDQHLRRKSQDGGLVVVASGVRK